MNLGFGLVRGEGISQAGFLRNLEGIADAHIVGGKSHDAAEECPVGSMAVIGLRKGSVKGEICPDHAAADHFLSQKTDAGRACCVELDGPIMFGPSTSKTLINDILSLPEFL